MRVKGYVVEYFADTGTVFSKVLLQGVVVKYCTDTVGSCTVMYRYEGQLYSTLQIQRVVVQ